MTARNNLDQLKAALSDRAEQLLVALFGQPTKRTAREWRWGSRGSIVYRHDRGTFYSFEEGRGGDLLSAIMFRDGCSFSQAIAWARAWLGDDTTKPTTSRKIGRAHV